MPKLQSKTEIELFVIGRVKEMRIEKGLSQAKLAHELDLSVGFIGHIENPKHRAKYNLNHINTLVKIFECSFKDFFPTSSL